MNCASLISGDFFQPFSTGAGLVHAFSGGLMLLLAGADVFTYCQMLPCHKSNALRDACGVWIENQSVFARDGDQALQVGIACGVHTCCFDSIHSVEFPSPRIIRSTSDGL